MSDKVRAALVAFLATLAAVLLVYGFITNAQWVELVTRALAALFTPAP